MANYSILDGQITSNIYTNGVQAITGAVLQGVLLDMVTSLGKHYQFGGVALPAGVFTAGDENVAFFAYTAGTYTNYGGFTLNGNSLHVLTYNGSWTDTDTGIPTGAALTAAIAAALASVDNDYAKKVGFYPALVAGSAASLLGAPVEKIFQAYVARQSGQALIDQLKGNAIVWNELVKNGDFSDGLDNWDKAGGSNVPYSVTDGVLTYSQNASGDYGVYQRLNEAVNGHKVLVSFEVTAVTGSPYMGVFRGTFTSVALATQVSAPGKYAAIVTLDLGSTSHFVFGAGRGGVGTGASIKNVSIIDLTILGIDSLTTAEQVEAWLLQNIGSTGPFGYNAGTVLPFCASSLQAQSGTEDLPLAPETWEDTDGNLIFPHGGMFAAGSAFDFAKVDPDGYIRKGTRVFGAVDMGTLNWQVLNNGTSNERFNAGVSGIKTFASSTVANIICPIYKADSANAAYIHARDKIIASSAGTVSVYDSNEIGTTAAAFKSAMSGVMLYYELATPVEKTLAQPVNVLFVQAAGENVSLDPANGDTPYTAAARMDLREPDAVSAGTLQNLLEALKTAGVISAYTMTWDAASGTYQFTVTA